MTPQRWAQLKDLYRSVLEEQPEERQKMLGGIREIDPGLCAELEYLLRQSAPPGDISGSVESSAVLRQHVLDAAVARQIPVYKPSDVAVLIRRLESGGLTASSAAGEKIPAPPEAAPSMPIQLDFPLDQEGRLKPLELHVRLVCPDFEPRTLVKALQVPPAGDSMVCRIPIAPRILGEVTVHLELFLGDAPIASRVLKTEVRPSERYIADVSSVVASIPLPVLARGSEVSPAAGSAEGAELASTLEMPAAEVTAPAPEPPPPPPPMQSAPAPLLGDDPGGFTRMVQTTAAGAGDASPMPGNGGFSSDIPVETHHTDAETIIPIVGLPGAPPPVPAVRPKRNPLLVLLAVFGPLFLLALAIMLFFARKV
jgi:hypothetical protein